MLNEWGTFDHTLPRSWSGIPFIQHLATSLLYTLFSSLLFFFSPSFFCYLSIFFYLTTISVESARLFVILSFLSSFLLHHTWRSGKMTRWLETLNKQGRRGWSHVRLRRTGQRTERFGYNHLSARRKTVGFLSVPRQKWKFTTVNTPFHCLPPPPFPLKSSLLSMQCTTSQKLAHHVNAFLFILDLGEIEKTWPHLASQSIRNSLVHTPLKLKSVKHSSI